MLGAVGVLVSCGSTSSDAPPLLISQVAGARTAGESIFAEAKQLDRAGKSKKALSRYREVADDFPLAKDAPEARLREAQLLEQTGQPLPAFDAYHAFIQRYQGSPNYRNALMRQRALADDALSGKIYTSFFGLKSKISLDKRVKMLGQLRDNAPESAIGAQAQMQIAELLQADGNDKDAIEAYRKVASDYRSSSQAPEALFRIGKVLIAQAERGNQNRATLDLAREAFQDYLNQYPGHGRAGEARRLIDELNSKSVERTLDVADFYRKTKEWESAKVYYRLVMKRQASGALHDRAAKSLREIGG